MDFFSQTALTAKGMEAYQSQQIAIHYFPLQLERQHLGRNRDQHSQHIYIHQGGISPVD